MLVLVLLVAMEKLAGILIAISLITSVYGVKDCAQVSVTTASGNAAPAPGSFCSGDLIFEDNFDTFNFHNWQHENTLAGGGNWEFEWYTNNRSNSYTDGGILHIAPTFVADEYGNDFLYSGTIDVNGGSYYEQCTNPSNWGCSRTGNANNILNPIKSARIRTIDSFAFKYGKVEVRAKIPSGDWLWPAIWMLPKYNEYSTWPSSGEIDIMESRGNKAFHNPDGVNIGSQQVSSTLHWGPNYNYNRYPLTHFERNLDAGYDADYHSYQLEWTPNYLKFLIDDVELGTVQPNSSFWDFGGFGETGLNNPWKYSTNPQLAPFDAEFYILFNLAVGGTNFFPDGFHNDNGDKPWSNTSPTAYKDFWEGRGQWESTWNRQSDDSHLKIDYVRVWAV